MSAVIEGELARTQRQLDALTGLRIVAALWVFAHHISADLMPRMPLLAVFDPLVSRGGLGVDLFFILSGFILSYNYVDKLGRRYQFRTMARFIRLRFARVYPVHLVTLLSSAFLVGVTGILNVPYQERSDNTPFTFIENLLLVQAWFGQPYSWNGVAWSVSAEWFAYLLFPVAALALTRIRTFGVAAIFALGVCAAGGVAQVILSESNSDDRPDNVLIRISVAFVIGSMLHRIYASTGSGVIWAVVAPVSIAAIVVLAYVPGVLSAVFLVPLGLLILSLAHGGGAVGIVLSTKPFVWGGAISYSFYMVHSQILQVFGALLFDQLSDNVFVSLALLAASFAAVIGCAAVLFYIVEEPSRRLLRGSRPPSR